MAIPKANTLPSLFLDQTTDKQEKNDEMTAEMTIKELIEKMREVNELVKANKFSTLLGAQIYDICQIIKRGGMGKEMEETHKTELNKFFAAIRQAACHEGGTLGLPCRLKVMELLEFRAMGWRTNLSSANYYAKRENAMPKTTNTTNATTTMPMEMEVQQQMNNMNKSTAFLPNQTNLVTIAQPFQQQHQQQEKPTQQSSPIIPFSPFAIPPPPVHPITGNVQLPQTCLMHSPESPNMPTAFYFIPSRAGTFIPATNMSTPLHPPPQANSKFKTSIFDGLNIESGQIFNSDTKSSRIIANQLREEITIRNSDSGKVMGVKGRRVALIEEISKTVISFQKVDPKCKERQLTIVADEKEAIDCAKKLIAKTIERNVSPEGLADHFDESQQKDATNDNNGNGIHIKCNNSKDNKIIAEKQAPVEKMTTAIRVDKESDGSLKITSSDPSILEAAQTALSEYLLKCMGMGNDVADGRDSSREYGMSEEKGSPSLITTSESIHGSAINDRNGTGNRSENTISYKREALLNIRRQQQEQKGGGRQMMMPPERTDKANKLSSLDIFVAEPKML